MDQFDDIYKERIAALWRAMYATKCFREDSVPSKIEEVTRFSVNDYISIPLFRLPNILLHMLVTLFIFLELSGSLLGFHWSCK